MSFYSSQDIKNELLEPSVHNETDRTEFRIHGDCLPSLKLLNNGRFGNAGTEYNHLVGALGNIKNLFIYDGKVELTAIRDFNRVMGFKNLQQNNHHNSDVDRFLKRHKIGYQSHYHDDNTRYERETSVKNGINNAFPVNDSLTNAARLYFDLREAFNMLQKVPILTDKVFKQLRIVLEYSRDNDDFQLANNLATLNCRPILAVDRIVNPVVAQNLANSLSVLNYTEIEHDRVSVAEINPVVNLAIQPTSRKVLGFNGKMVSNLRITKNYLVKTNHRTTGGVLGNAVIGFGVYESLNGYREKFQLVVNGRPIFPRSGVEGENRRLAMLTDTHGDLNLYETAHLDVATAYVDKSLAGDATKDGVLDFFGTELSERINELQVDYERTALTDTSNPSKYNASLELLITCDVMKTLQVGNGTYRVSYM